MPKRAALDVLEHNDWKKLDGIRLNAEVHDVQWYTLDLLVLHRPTRSVLIVDVKRSISSYKGRRLDALLKRMRAAGLTAASWIYAKHKGLR